MYIGFLDSGIGGLTVLKETMAVLPDEKYIYYADTQNVPYGTKTRAEVKELVFKAVEFIAAQGIKALVVACNTATSIAVEELRGKYPFPVIGMEPAVKPAVACCQDKRVLVMATPLTLQEPKYHDLVARLNSRHLVDSLPMPELVSLAEDFEFNEEVVMPYLKEKLSSYKLEHYGTLVLGCTHFIFFKRHLEQLLPKSIQVIDGNRGTVNRLIQILRDQNLFAAKQNMRKPQEARSAIKHPAVLGIDQMLCFSSNKKEEDNTKYYRYLQYLQSMETKRVNENQLKSLFIKN